MLILIKSWDSDSSNVFDKVARYQKFRDQSNFKLGCILQKLQLPDLLSALGRRESGFASGICNRRGKLRRRERESRRPIGK